MIKTPATCLLAAQTHTKLGYKRQLVSEREEEIEIFQRYRGSNL